MTPSLQGTQQTRKFSRGSQRRPVRPLLRRGALSLRKATRQSQRMNARRTGLRGL